MCMEFIFIAAGIIHVLLILHACFITRNLLWVLIIVIIPFFGDILYILAEIIPRIAHKSHGVRIPVPNAVLVRRAQQAFEELDSLDNRVRLAELYARSGRHDEAIAMLEPSLQGLGKQNPHVLLALAHSYVAREDFERARQFIADGEALERQDTRRANRLLLAEILAKEGRYAEAEPLFSQAKQGFPGEEAYAKHCYYLFQSGQYDKAKALAQSKLKELKKAPGKYKRDEKEWIELIREVAQSDPIEHEQDTDRES